MGKSIPLEDAVPLSLEDDIRAWKRYYCTRTGTCPTSIVRVTVAVESGPAGVVAVTVRASGRWPTVRVQDAVNAAVSGGVHVCRGAEVSVAPSLAVRRSNVSVTGRSRAGSGRGSAGPSGIGCARNGP